MALRCISFISMLVIAMLMVKDVKGQTCSMTSPCAFTGGDPLYVIPEVSSPITLDVDVSDIVIEWLTIHRRAWNGTMPGPTWRVRRGTTLVVNLINNLQLPHKTEALNDQRYPNTTNLHTHGLHIGSNEPQDNVFVHVHPGETYTYTYQIDADQPAGTYWYHPHIHGSTMFQVHSGMAGIIIVEDETTGTSAMPSHLADVSCPDNCQHEVSLLFQHALGYINNAGRGFANLQNNIEDSANFGHAQYTIDAGGTLEDWLTDNANNIDYYTTNGQMWPVYTMATGQVKRFRMVNAAGSATLELLITDVGGTTAAGGCEFQEIAYDGIYLDAPRTPARGKTMLVPSSKADWLVVCNTAGTYELRSVPANVDDISIGGFQRYSNNLLTITVTGTGTGAIGTTLPARETFVSDMTNIAQEDLYGRCVIELSPGTRLNRELFSSETYYRCKLEVDRPNEIYLINTDPNTGHPLHIHINHFQVTSYNAYTGAVGNNGRGPNGGGLTYFQQNGDRCFYQHANYNANGNGNLGPNALEYLGHDTRCAAGGVGTLGCVPIGDWRDVVLVPPLANMSVRFWTHSYTGEVVIHCHILNHEDSGMMYTFEIVSQGADLTSNVASGTAYPGTCAETDVYPFNRVVETNNAGSVSSNIRTMMLTTMMQFLAVGSLLMI